MSVATASKSIIKDKPLELIPLDKLLLDPRNPRFSEFISNRSTQRDILNVIVKHFGVDDVLSSIAVSGYFSAEPLVCRKQPDGRYIVAEGNRRLAAMLILSADERATDHLLRHEKFKEIHERHNSPAYNPVPSIVFTEEDGNESLLSYLGVRHIVSTKEWDSYAKAAWVAEALQTSKLQLADIAEMIGDNRGTIQRLLTGYHFVNQLQLEGQFNPDNSIRKGRGSNSRYPFSWVYTILGYESVKSFTQIDNDPHNAKPIPREKIDHAGLVLRSMFGDSSKGIKPAIDDSRQLSDLAKVFASPEKVAYLRNGKSVQEIESQTQPLDDFLGSSLIDVLTKLREINGRLIDETIPMELASQLRSTAQLIKRQAESLQKTLMFAEAGGSADSEV